MSSLKGWDQALTLAEVQTTMLVGVLMRESAEVPVLRLPEALTAIPAQV